MVPRIRIRDAGPRFARQRTSGLGLGLVAKATGKVKQAKNAIGTFRPGVILPKTQGTSTLDVLGLPAISRDFEPVSKGFKNLSVEL